jgi:hypothetical protein
MQRLWRDAQTQGRGLLRVLLLWRRAMPANTGSETAWPRRRMLLGRIRLHAKFAWPFYMERGGPVELFRARGSKSAFSPHIAEGFE